MSRSGAILVDVVGSEDCRLIALAHQPSPMDHHVLRPALKVTSDKLNNVNC